MGSGAAPDRGAVFLFLAFLTLLAVLACFALSAFFSSTFPGPLLFRFAVMAAFSPRLAGASSAACPVRRA